MEKKKLIIIGGGAAGFFCAVNAARLNPDLEVVILEKSNKILSKVRVSGGGRCNVTHSCFRIAEMVKRYPRGANFLKKTFHQFFTNDTIAWFSERGVELKTEADGRMFPVTDSSQTIIDCLVREANKLGVRWYLNHEVKKISVSHTNIKASSTETVPGVSDDTVAALPPGANSCFPSETTSDSIQKNTNSGFLLETSHGQMKADFLLIACGGFPKASQFGWLTELGHNIEEPVPSLFTFNMPGNPITKLMGISADQVQVKINGTKLVETGPLLITHWGISGPAVLKLSAWGARELNSMNYQFSITINWVPEFNENSIRPEILNIRTERAKQKVVNRNPFRLPQRLWEHLLEMAGINEDWKWAELPAKEQNRLIKLLCGMEMPVSGKTTFKEEFVTCGGIQLSDIDPNTCMSRFIPELYFAGEILNVDGITGGFNFQHAWTSGFIVARTVSEKSMQKV